MQLKSIEAADLDGKRVLLRLDLNVAFDGDIGDDFRLHRSLPTVEYLSRHGASVVILSHLGRAGASLEPVAKAFAALTQVPIRFFGGQIAAAVEESKKSRAGECVVLENIRRDPREEANDPSLAAELAQLGELFVNDAFADSHRVHASIVGMPTLLPSYAGLLMKKEIEKLSEVAAPAHPAFAIIGGAKFDTKVPLLAKLLTLYDRVLLGGELGVDMLKSRGAPVGASLVSETPVPTELAGDERIFVPSDVAVSTGTTNAGRSTVSSDVRAGERIVDIGPATAEKWAEMIADAAFVFWNGPMGIYEAGYVEATDTIAEALVQSKAKAVIGGGDTAASVSKFSFDQERIFLSTGGGASLQYLVDGTLPGIEALKESQKKYIVAVENTKRLGGDDVNDTRRAI